MSYLIGIDSGHGGKDSGATGNGKRESDIVLEISKKLEKELKTRGYKTLMTRTNDTYVSLTRRSNMFNNNNVDVGLSIHLNAFGNSSANGVETFYHKTSTKGHKLARLVHNEIKKYWATDRGLKTNNLHMTRETKMPTILLELGFITNVSDLNNTLAYQDDIVKSIVDGLDKYFGKQSQAPKSLYRVRESWSNPSSQVGAYGSLELAKQQADKHNLKVFNEKGELVYPKTHWADKHFKSLADKGFVFSDKRFNDNVTRGELFAALDKITGGSPLKEEIIRDGMITYVKIPLTRIKDFNIAVGGKKTVRKMLGDYDYIINGGFFWTSAEVGWKNYSVNELIIDGKTLVLGGDFSKIGLGQDKDKNLYIERFDPSKQYRHFIGGSPTLILDGKVKIDHSIGHENQRHPRSAIGLTKDSLILLTADGRQLNKAGMTLKELANYLLKIGCTGAINLDGGGSTRLESKQGVLNNPTENRKIHNAIRIRVD